MTANVAGSSGVSDQSYGQSRRQPPDRGGAPAQAASDAAGAQPSDLILSIEKDPMSGGFVYVVVDRRTGAIVRRLDREQLLRLRDAASYSAGAVLSTRA